MAKKIVLIVLCVLCCPWLHAWTKVADLGGKIVQVEIDPIRPNLVLAVTNDGIYRSADGGATWKKTLEGVGRIGIQPGTSAIYAILDTATGGFTFSRKLWLSLDGGATFKVRKVFDLLKDPLPYPGPIFFDPLDSKKLFSADRDGRILVSTNAGLNWKFLITPDSFRFSEVYVSPLNPSHVYLSGSKIPHYVEATDKVEFLSRDSARTWEKVSTRPPACRSFAFYTDPFFKRILVSSCDGTATRMGNGVVTSNLRNVHSIVSVPGMVSSLFALQDAGSGMNLYFGVNRGETWKPRDNLRGKISALGVLNNLQKWVIAGTSDGKIYRERLSSFL